MRALQPPTLLGRRVTGTARLAIAVFVVAYALIATEKIHRVAAVGAGQRPVTRRPAPVVVEDGPRVVPS